MIARMQATAGTSDRDGGIGIEMIVEGVHTDQGIAVEESQTIAPAPNARSDHLVQRTH